MTPSAATRPRLRERRAVVLALALGLGGPGVVAASYAGYDYVPQPPVTVGRALAPVPVYEPDLAERWPPDLGGNPLATLHVTHARAEDLYGSGRWVLHLDAPEIARLDLPLLGDRAEAYRSYVAVIDGTPVRMESFPREAFGMGFTIYPRDADRAEVLRLAHTVTTDVSVAERRP